MLFFRKKERIQLPDGFTVTAHSGCMGLPDNSLEAMDAGIRAGALIVEFDLRYDEAGTPVLSHDAPTGIAVTLREVFAFLAARPGVLANVDVKSTAYLEKVPPLAAETGVADRIFFTGIRADDVPAVRQKAPGVPYYLNTDVGAFGSPAALADRIAALGAVGLNVHWRQLTPAVTRCLRERGLQVSVWTVNAPKAIRSAMSMGPDNITSRRPDLVIAEIKK